MHRGLGRWQWRPPNHQSPPIATKISLARDATSLARDGLAVLGLFTLGSLYLWGVGYFSGLFGGLHVTMADLLTASDIHFVLLRRGDFLVNLGCQLFVCVLLAGASFWALRANIKRAGKWRRALVYCGQIVLPPLLVATYFIAPLIAADIAGQHDAKSFKDDAKSFQGKQGCRTVILFEKDATAPWPAPPKNCASLVAVLSGRAVILADDATYVVDSSKIRAVRFNAWPDRSVSVGDAAGLANR